MVVQKRFRFDKLRASYISPTKQNVQRATSRLVDQLQQSKKQFFIMESNPLFNLRWHNHSFNILQVFSEQLSSESLVDVTLSCQGQFLKAHKMVLSACSLYFQDLFNIHQVKHPVIILNGVKFAYLRLVVEFMYRGEARVLESDLDGILAVAEALQVKGLGNVRTSSDKQSGDCNEFLPGDEMELVSEQYNEDPASDPLQIPSPSIDSLKPPSNKPPRKRKRISEKKVISSEDKLSKVARTEASLLTQHEKSLPRAIAPKPAKLATSTPKTSPRAIPAKATPQSSLSPSKTHLSKTTSEVDFCLAKEQEQEEGNTQVLPFVQVSLKEPQDDDIDLTSTIKVEPLFIRDIDDNDTSWDDPTRLVIDLPSEETEEKRNGSEENRCPSESKIDESNNQDLKKSKSRKKTQKEKPVKTTVVHKPQVKVRPASELVATSHSLQCSSDGAVLETNSSIDHSQLQVEIPKERCKGGKIPRPPNAFMIFANEWRRKLAFENPSESNKEISVRLGMKWKTLSTENKEVYFTASRRADEEHKRKYPNYFYSPKEARIQKSLRQKNKKPNPQVRIEKTVPPIDALKLTFNKVASENENEAVYHIDEDGSVTVKEEVLDAESNPNFEEEFLKLVEDGHVEAEVEGESEEVNCVPASQDSASEEKQSQ